MLSLHRGAVRALATSAFPAIDASVGGAPRLERLRASPRSASRALLLGTVCYSESVASIWKGIMRHFARRGLDVETILYSSYERMNSALLAGSIHIAWNGPLSHARLVRLVGPARVLALGMRDSDRDFASHCIVRSDAGIAGAGDLAHRRLALGTVDSPQAYILPLASLQARAVPLHTLTVMRYDRDVGKHGDTAHGETGVLEALGSGAAEAGFVSGYMWERALRDTPAACAGLAPCPALAVPAFDHCQFSALKDKLHPRRALAFQQALLAMGDGSGHAEDAQTLALEGVRKAWLPSRGGALPPHRAGQPPGPMPDPTAGYGGMLEALEGFGEGRVLWPGHLHTPKRHPFKHLVIDSSLVRDSFGC